MKRVFFAQAVLLLLVGFVGLSPVTAQDDLSHLTRGRPLTADPPMEEKYSDGGTPWREDIRKVTEGLSAYRSPEEYREALRLTGMEDFLAADISDPAGKSETWIQRGPLGGFGAPRRNGRIAGIEIIDPADAPPTIYVGSCQGGLWMTRESGPTGPIWVDIGRKLPNPSVRGFAVDPDNSQHIIVGTGDHSRYNGSGMYVTLNGGGNWIPRSTPATPSWYYRIFFQERPGFTPNDHVIAASSSGLLVSADRGVSWSLAQFADGSQATGLWTDLVEHPTSPNIYYACVAVSGTSPENGIYKSTDYGETWSHQADPDLPQAGNWGRASLAICRSEPSVLAVMVESGSAMQGIFRTTDGGGNWYEITGVLSGFGGDQIRHAQAIAIHPTLSDVIYVGAVSLAMSVDGGRNWLIGSGLTGINYGHADITQIYFSDVVSEDNIYICNDGGIYIHNIPNGISYDYLGGATTGLACSEVDFMDAQRNYRAMGLQDNGVIVSETDGQTWIFEESGDGAAVSIYDPVGGDHMFVNGVWPEPHAWQAWRTQIRGLAVPANNPHPVYMPSLSHGIDSGQMISHDRESIYRTNAATGTLWDRVATDLQSNTIYTIRSVTQSNSGDGALYTLYWSNHPGDLTIVRFVEGQGWVKHHTEDVTGNGQMITSVTPSREWPGEAWITLRGQPGQPKIMHTTDYGATWADITNQLSSVATVETLEVQPFNPLVLYAGTDLGMFRSTDGGLNWFPFQTGLPIGRCKVLKFVVDPFGAEHTLELAMDGRGLWTVPVSAPRILFVDRDATGPEAGSREHPYHSVNTAMQYAPAGSILAVRSNTYDEPFVYSGDVVVVTWSGESVIR